ncbi:MAG: TetR/AcrR family transcriptional regulator [Gammaproteobacteria bacterium]
MNSRTNNDRKRAEITKLVANHLVVQGFGNSGIRSLASSAGLSNRMLLYYFESKEALIHESLMFIADGLEQELDTLLPADGVSGKQILNTLVDAGRSDAVKPLLHLFFELVGLAMRGGEPYRTLTRTLLERWQRWIEKKLRAGQKHQAPEIMARLEGHLLINLIFED